MADGDDQKDQKKKGFFRGLREYFTGAPNSPTNQAPQEDLPLDIKTLSVDDAVDIARQIIAGKAVKFENEADLVVIQNTCTKAKVFVSNDQGVLKLFLPEHKNTHDPIVLAAALATAIGQAKEKVSLEQNAPVLPEPVPQIKATRTPDELKAHWDEQKRVAAAKAASQETNPTNQRRPRPIQPPQGRSAASSAENPNVGRPLPIRPNANAQRKGPILSERDPNVRVPVPESWNKNKAAENAGATESVSKQKPAETGWQKTNPSENAPVRAGFSRSAKRYDDKLDAEQAALEERLARPEFTTAEPRKNANARTTAAPIADNRKLFSEKVTGSVDRALDALYERDEKGQRVPIAGEENAKKRADLIEIIEFRYKHSEYLAGLREDAKDGISREFNDLLAHKKDLEAEIKKFDSQKDPLSRMLAEDYKQKVIEVEQVAKEVFNKEIWKDTGPGKDVQAKSGLGSRQKQREQELKTLQESGSAKISVEKVDALSRKENRNDIAPLLNNPSDIQVKCPPRILQEFQKLIGSAPKLLGAHFENPYTGKIERFPDKAEDFTARHLQILARNENVNVTGSMNRAQALYGDALTVDQVARLRCLVKATTVSGLVNVGIEGGYPKIGSEQKKDAPEKMVLIDQSGLQWQGDLRNTGGMFFYPNDMASVKIDNYAAWQADMYKAMYGGERPKTPSANSVEVQWKGITGKLDLTQVALGIHVEFLQALEAAGSIKDNDNPDKKVNLRYLKAGMGFFANGLTIEGKNGKDHPKLLGARLDGIIGAFEYLKTLPEAERKQILGNLGRVELPFSEGEQFKAKLQTIEELAKAVGLEWGGAGPKDALASDPRYINASTTGADPHAMPGNEGGYRSVDAMMSMNARIEHLNAAANVAMKLSPSVDFGQAITDKINYGLTQLRDSGNTPEEKEAAKKKAASMKGLVQVLLETGIPLDANNPDYAKESKKATQLCQAILSDRKTTVADVLEEVRSQLEKHKDNPQEQVKILARSQFMLNTLMNLNLSDNFKKEVGLDDLRTEIVLGKKDQSDNAVKQKFKEIEDMLPQGLKNGLREKLKQDLKQEVIIAPPLEQGAKQLVSVDELMKKVGKGQQSNFNKSVEQMASDIMINSTERYLKIKEDNFYEKGWETGGADNNLRLMDEGINKITHNLVAVSVIKGTNNITEMAQRANFWVKVAEKLLEKGDYPSAMAISAAIQSAELPPDVLQSPKFKQKELDNVNAQLSPTKNNEAYRKAIVDRKEYIPLTSISQQELLLNTEGNSRIDNQHKILNTYRLQIQQDALQNAVAQTQNENLLRSVREKTAPTFDLAAVFKEPTLTDKEVIAIRIARVEIAEKGSLAAKGGQGSTLGEVYGQLLEVGKRTLEVSTFEGFTADKDRRQDKTKPEAINSTLLKFVQEKLVADKTGNSENYEISRGYAAGIINFVEQYAKKNKVQLNEDTKNLIVALKNEHDLKNVVIPTAVSPTTATPTVAEVQPQPVVVSPVSPTTAIPTVATVTTAQPQPTVAGFKRAEPKKVEGQEQPASKMGSAARTAIEQNVNFDEAPKERAVPNRPASTNVSADDLDQRTAALATEVNFDLDDEKPAKKKGKKAKRSKDKATGSGIRPEDIKSAEAAIGNFASMADFAKQDVASATVVVPQQAVPVATATVVAPQQAVPVTDEEKKAAKKAFTIMNVAGEVVSTEETYLKTAKSFFEQAFNPKLAEGELTFKEKLTQLSVKGDDANHKTNFFNFLATYEKSIATSAEVIAKSKVLAEFVKAKQEKRAPVGLPEGFSPDVFLEKELEPALKAHMAVLDKCIEGFPNFLDASAALSKNKEFEKLISEMNEFALTKDSTYQGLSATAITTVQRIPRYQLFAREFGGYEGFPDEGYFATAAFKANSTIRDADNKKMLVEAKEALFNKIKNPEDNVAAKEYYSQLTTFLSQSNIETNFTDSELKIVLKNINKLHLAYEKNNPDKGPNIISIMKTSLIDEGKALETVGQLVSLGCSIRIGTILPLLDDKEKEITVSLLPEKMRSGTNLLNTLNAIAIMKKEHGIEVNHGESREFIAYLAMELNNAKASKKPDSYEQKLLEMSEKAFGQNFVKDIDQIVISITPNGPEKPADNAKDLDKFMWAGAIVSDHLKKQMGITQAMATEKNVHMISDVGSINTTEKMRIFLEAVLILQQGGIKLDFSDEFKEQSNKYTVNSKVKDLFTKIDENIVIQKQAGENKVPGAFDVKSLLEVEKNAPENEEKDKENKVSRRRRFGQTLGAINPLRTRNRESQQAEPIVANPIAENISNPINVPLASNVVPTFPIKPADVNDKQKMVEWAEKVVDFYFKTGTPAPQSIEVKAKVDTETQQFKLLVEAMVALKANGTQINIPEGSRFADQLLDFGMKHTSDLKASVNVRILLTPNSPNATATATNTQPNVASSVNPTVVVSAEPTTRPVSVASPSTVIPRSREETGFPLLLKNAHNAAETYLSQNPNRRNDSAVMGLLADMSSIQIRNPLTNTPEQKRQALEQLLTQQPPKPGTEGITAFIVEKLGNDLKVLPQPQRPLPSRPKVAQNTVASRSPVEPQQTAPNVTKPGFVRAIPGMLSRGTSPGQATTTTQAFNIEGSHIDYFKKSQDMNLESIISSENPNRVEFNKKNANQPKCVATFKPAEADKPGVTTYSYYASKPESNFHTEAKKDLLAFLVKKAFDAHLNNDATKDKKLVITVLKEMSPEKQDQFVELIQKEAQERIQKGVLTKENIAVMKAGQPEPIPLDLKKASSIQLGARRNQDSQ